MRSVFIPFGDGTSKGHVELRAGGASAVWRASSKKCWIRPNGPTTQIAAAAPPSAAGRSMMLETSQLAGGWPPLTLVIRWRVGQLLDEIRARKLDRIAAGYAVAAWVLIQAAA